MGDFNQACLITSSHVHIIAWRSSAVEGSRPGPRPRSRRPAVAVMAFELAIIQPADGGNFPPACDYEQINATSSKILSRAVANSVTSRWLWLFSPASRTMKKFWLVSLGTHPDFGEWIAKPCDHRHKSANHVSSRELASMSSRSQCGGLQCACQLARLSEPLLELAAMPVTSPRRHPDLHVRRVQPLSSCLAKLADTKEKTEIDVYDVSRGLGDTIHLCTVAHPCAAFTYKALATKVKLAMGLPKHIPVNWVSPGGSSLSNRRDVGGDLGLPLAKRRRVAA